MSKHFYFRKSFRETHLMFSVFCKNSSNFCNEQFFKPTREFATLSTSVFARICKITCHQNIFTKMVPFFPRICKISCYQNIFTKLVPSSSMLLTNLLFSGLNLRKIKRFYAQICFVLFSQKLKFSFQPSMFVLSFCLDHSQSESMRLR